MNTSAHWTPRRLAGMALFSAITVMLQLLGSFIRFGPFSISLVTLPIVVGAVLYGTGAGAWFGFVFAMTVLLSGDAGAFLAVSVVGTLLTVLAKGIACGAAAGLACRIAGRAHDTLGAVLAALVCPLVNTGVFLLGCRLFFMPTIRGWAEAMGFGANALGYMIFGLVGANFLFELGSGILLCPVILRLVRLGRKERT